MRRSITPDSAASGSQKRRKITNNASTFTDDDILGVSGKIKKIVLQNFMCHKNLEFNFGDKVNFLSGKNGSGKSAVLTSLVIGLGGRATDTNRGISLQNLILNGQQHCAIEITLSNVGLLSYKKNLYGDEIKIVRTISEQSSNYKIISSSGRTVSTKRNELDQIMMWFNIQVNNPVCVLNQDIARTFLKSADPKELYKFFMKGTLLEDIFKICYNLHNESLPSLDRALANKNLELEESGKEISEIKNKLEKLGELSKIKGELSQNQNELQWAHVLETEKNLQIETNMLEDLERNLSHLREKVNKKDIVEKQLKDKQVTLEENLKEVREKNQVQENEISKAEKKYSEIKEVHLKKQAEIKRLQKKIAYDEKSCQELVLEIDRIKSQSEEAETKRIQISEEKKQLVNRLTELNAVKSTLEVHKQQLSDTLANATHNLTTKQHYMNNVENKIRGKKQYLNALRKQKNELSVYSNWMPDLVSAINKAYQQGGFEQKPRGPLGSYIKLKEESWGPAVESLIGRRTLCSFCINSAKDMKTFDRLVKMLKIPAREKPTAAISRFLTKVYNVEKYEVYHQKYTSLLRALIISDCVVANTLIDQIQIEHVLLIPTGEEAYGLMEDINCVPINCKRALTKKGEVFYPQPNYRSYAGHILDKSRFLQVSPEEAVRMVETELNSLNSAYEECRKETEIAEKESNDLKLKVADTNKELNKIWKQINMSETRITELDNQDDGGNTDFNFLLEDLEFRQKALSASQNSLKEMEVEANLTHEEFSSAKQQLKELENSRISYQDTVTKFQEELASVKQECCKLVNNWKNFRKQLSDEEDHVTNVRTKIIQIQENLNIFNQTAEKCCPRIENVQSVKSLEKKVLELSNKIKALETYVGGTTVKTGVEYEMELSAMTSTLNFIAFLSDKIKFLIDTLEIVDGRYGNSKQMIITDVRRTFRCMLSMRNYQGGLQIDLKNQILKIDVKPHKEAKEGSGTVSLSGGERSFSMVSLIMALWAHMNLPFYILDEFDVFMDPINRSMVVSLLLAHAKDKPKQQFIFLTPNNLGCAVSEENVSMFKLEDPRN